VEVSVRDQPFLQSLLVTHESMFIPYERLKYRAPHQQRRGASTDVLRNAVASVSSARVALAHPGFLFYGRDRLWVNEKKPVCNEWVLVLPNRLLVGPDDSWGVFLP
jgi:hypothetical protein